MHFEAQLNGTWSRAANCVIWLLFDAIPNSCFDWCYVPFQAHVHETVDFEIQGQGFMTRAFFPKGIGTGGSIEFRCFGAFLCLEVLFVRSSFYRV